jgi:serine/threonine-protein kinase Chk1
MGVVLYTLLVGSESSSDPWDKRCLSSDTPWDEPSDNSPEYKAYLTGELLQYDPWTRIRGQARCESEPSLHVEEKGERTDKPAVLLGMLTIDPNSRLTMDGITSHPWCMTWVSS